MYQKINKRGFHEDIFGHALLKETNVVHRRENLVPL